MSARSVRHLVAVVVALGAVAVLPAAASAHPEACADATLASMPNATFEDWDDVYEECLSQAAQQNFDDSAAQLAPGETGTKNLKLLANIPKETPFETTSDLNSDLAFENGYAFQGNYDGIQVFDVRDPENPQLVTKLHCPGSQNDVTVNDGILVTSTDSRRNKAECEGNVGSPDTTNPATNWEGIRIFDVSDPTSPEYVTAVRTACGSHTHTVLPERNRLLIYVSSYDIGAGRYDCEDKPDPFLAHDQISIVEIPRDNPEDAEVINEPHLFPDGGNRGEPGGTVRANGTTGCHDITVYQKLDIAAGACTGEGVIMDISDPENPEVIANVEDPNFAFWHSATISNDGRKVLFTDELGGGTAATCNPTVGPNRGADAIYDITDPANPKFMSYFKIPRTQTNGENCVAHNGNLIPNKKGRDILVQSWYQGGLSVIDWTNGRNVKEIAWFDRGPYPIPAPQVLAGYWSTYFYNGYIYGSEIQRGFDVFKLNHSSIAGSRAFKTRTLNAQTQYPQGKPGWGHGRDDD
jgi:hypothetical protein